MAAQLLIDQLLQCLRAGGAYLQQKAPLANHAMYFLHPWQLNQEVVNFLQIAAGSCFYEDKRGDRQAECQWINQRGIAFDVPALLQQLDPPQHSRWRKTD